MCDSTGNSSDAPANNGPLAFSLAPQTLKYICWDCVGAVSCMYNT